MAPTDRNEQSSILISPNSVRGNIKVILLSQLSQNRQGTHRPLGYYRYVGFCLPKRLLETRIGDLAPIEICGAVITSGLPTILKLDRPDLR